MVKKTKKPTFTEMLSTKKRKLAFTDRDLLYIKANPTIKLGNHVGKGDKGDVFAIKKNRNMVVKVSRGFADNENKTRSERMSLTTGLFGNRGRIEKEANLYRDNDLVNEPLFIPTEIVDMGTNDLNNGNYIGLVRPRVNMLPDPSQANNKRKPYGISDIELEDLRRKIILLSHEGYQFNDGFQLGRDSTGRIMVYDADSVRRYVPTNPEVFRVNNYFWQYLLQWVRKYNPYTESDVLRYGIINMNEYY
jgi:hypothetical protein